MRRSAVALGLGGLALFAALVRPRRPSASIPPAAVAILRAHAPEDDVRSLLDAVGQHVAKGHPLTRAALAALATAHLDPDALPAIVADLKRAGLY